MKFTGSSSLTDDIANFKAIVLVLKRVSGVVMEKSQKYEIFYQPEAVGVGLHKDVRAHLKMRLFQPVMPEISSFYPLDSIFQRLNRKASDSLPSKAPLGRPKKV